MVEPRKTNSRLPTRGILARCSSKSPHTASISRPGYSSRMAELAASSTPASTSNGTKRRSDPLSRSAVSSSLVFSEVPLPSSTRVSAPLAAAIAGDAIAQDLRLGPGRVVLGQPGDLVEQVAADRVVEPLGRQRLRSLRQPVEHVAAQRLGSGVGGQIVRQRERHEDPFSGVSATRASAHLDQVAVGNVLPIGMVVVRFAGQHHAVVAAQHRQRVPPCGGQQSRSVGRQYVQPRIRDQRRRPRRCVSPRASRPRSKISAASSALSTVDSAAADGGSTAAVDHPVVRQQPAAVAERRRRADARSAYRPSPSAPRPPRSRCAAPAPPRRTTRRPTAVMRCASAGRRRGRRKSPRPSRRR